MLASQPLTDTGHAGHVQVVAVEAVTSEALRDTHAAAMGATLQDPALLCLQSLIGPSKSTCRERVEWTQGFEFLPSGSMYPLLNSPSLSRAVEDAVGPGAFLLSIPLSLWVYKYVSVLSNCICVFPSL